MIRNAGNVFKMEKIILKCGKEERFGGCCHIHNQSTVKKYRSKLYSYVELHLCNYQTYRFNYNFFHSELGYPVGPPYERLYIGRIELIKDEDQKCRKIL
jgi:hypothetical protein